MSNGSSSTGIPNGLAPIGGWKSGEGPGASAPLSPPPSAAPTLSPMQPAQTPDSPPVPAARSAMGTIGAAPAETAPLSPAPLTPPAVGGVPGSRFSTPPAVSAGTTAPPGSRFAVAPVPAAPVVPIAPAGAAAAPQLVAPAPERERAYNMAAAYKRGEVAPMGGGRMAAGIITGTIVGGIATALWIALYLFLPFWQLLFLGGGMGFLVGYSVFKATGEGEETSCWISCIISTIYAVGGILFINLAFFPNVAAMIFGIFAIGVASERGFRTPEVLAVETAF